MISVFILHSEKSDDASLQRTVKSLEKFPEINIVGKSSLVGPNIKNINPLVFSPLNNTQLPWIFILRSGDILYEDTFEIFHEYISKFPFIKMFYGSYDTSNNQSPPSFSYDARMIGQTNIVGETYILHRELFPQQPVNDHDLWKALSKNHIFYAIPHKLMYKNHS